MTMPQEMSDEQLAGTALNMWANYVETGHVSLSAIDCHKRGQRFKPLDISQMKLVIRMRELSLKLMSISGK